MLGLAKTDTAIYLN